MPNGATTGSRNGSSDEFDVVVVGGGNAAFCAALSAEEQGARVVVLERAPEDESGGNTRFTAGAIRFAYSGVEDLREVMPDLTDAEVAQSDFGTYTEDQFFDDMFRVTRNRTHPELCEILVRRSFETMKWLRGKGVRFQPIWGRQAFKVDGKFKFWGGLTVEAWGGGPGLVRGGNGGGEEARGRGPLRQPRHPPAARRLQGLRRRGEGSRGASTSCARPRWCSPPAASRAMPRCARAISGRAGNWPRCAARASTPATGSRWRSPSAPAPSATGPAAMRCSGTSTRRSTATSRSATPSRSTPIPGAC